MAGNTKASPHGYLAELKITKSWKILTEAKGIVCS